MIHAIVTQCCIHIYTRISISPPRLHTHAERVFIYKADRAPNIISLVSLLAFVFGRVNTNLVLMSVLLDLHVHG
jgi:hypothetical protein